MPFSLPAAMATMSASAMVMVQSALGGASCFTSPLLFASTVHSVDEPPGPPVMLKWKTPPTFFRRLGSDLRLAAIRWKTAELWKAGAADDGAVAAAAGRALPAFLAASKSGVTFCASDMFPLIFILPDMKACMPFSLPATSARKFSSLSVIVQSALPVPCLTVDCLQSTTHVLSPPWPPVSTKARDPPTLAPNLLSAESAAWMDSNVLADIRTEPRSQQRALGAKEPRSPRAA